MPIRAFLKGAAFSPERIEIMGIAFERALASLGLKDRSDPAVEIIAKRVIELGRSDGLDSSAITRQILAEFRAPEQTN